LIFNQFNLVAVGLGEEKLGALFDVLKVQFSILEVLCDLVDQD
jgi:hypothetical protein